MNVMLCDEFREFRKEAVGFFSLESLVFIFSKLYAIELISFFLNSLDLN
jgi:hypothetical protein